MNINHIKYLVCPKCSKSLELKRKKVNENNNIESGILICISCKSQYPIIRYIPRFVDSNNYASGFGYQWVKHSTTYGFNKNPPLAIAAYDMAICNGVAEIS